MSRYVRIVLILALVLIVLPVLPAGAAAPAAPLPPAGCVGFQLPSGALGLVCMPPAGEWNLDLVIFAHGYVAPGEPLWKGFEQLQLPGFPLTVPELVTGMHYALAVTSYRTNGLAIKDGVADLLELRQAFITYIAQQPGMAGYQPPHTYVVGVSEGGLVATLAIEQAPNFFSGGLACCGPVGDFQKQIDYWGNFRVVYDYFFPGILKQSYGGNAMNVPQKLINAWGSGVVPTAVADAIAADPGATTQLINVTHAAYDPSNPTTIVDTVLGILVYNVFATNDGIVKLGGIPFNNQKPDTLYTGSLDDPALNRTVKRFKADQAAIQVMNSPSYETTGVLSRPLVTMHNLLDPVVPYWQETDYLAKTGADGYHVNIPIDSYGHCNFTLDELVGAFGTLVFMVTGSPLVP